LLDVELILTMYIFFLFFFVSFLGYRFFDGEIKLYRPIYAPTGRIGLVSNKVTSRCEALSEFIHSRSLKDISLFGKK